MRQRVQPLRAELKNNIQQQPRSFPKPDLSLAAKELAGATETKRPMHCRRASCIVNVDGGPSGVVNLDNLVSIVGRQLDVG